MSGSAQVKSPCGRYHRGEVLKMEDGSLFYRTNFKQVLWKECPVSHLSDTAKTVAQEMVVRRNTGMEKRPYGELFTWIDPEREILVFIFEPGASFQKD